MKHGRTYLECYNKSLVDKDWKIIVPTIEEMLKLQMDRESGAKVLATSEFICELLTHFKRSLRSQKKKKSLSRADKKGCKYCLRKNHNSSSCWYIHLELTNKKFSQQYLNSEKKGRISRSSEQDVKGS